MGRKMLRLLDEEGLRAYEEELVLRLQVADRAFEAYLGDARDAPAGHLMEVRIETFRAVLAGLNFAIEEAHLARAERVAVAKDEARAAAAREEQRKTHTDAGFYGGKETPKAEESSGEGLGDVLKRLGFTENQGKEGLWRKTSEKRSLYWDFRRTPRGEFYATEPDKDGISRDESLKRLAEYREFRLAQEAQGGAEQQRIAVHPGLPKQSPAAGHERVLLRVPSHFKAWRALKEFGFAEAEEGLWWADLDPPLAEKRRAWAKMNGADPR